MAGSGIFPLFFFHFVKNTETLNWRPKRPLASALSLSFCAPLCDTEICSTFEVGFCSKHQGEERTPVGSAFSCNLLVCVEEDLRDHFISLSLAWTALYVTDEKLTTV